MECSRRADSKPKISKTHVDPSWCPPRLLLTTAMDRSQTVNHRGAIYSHNPSPGKTIPKNVQSSLIIGVPELWNYYDAVANVKIRVACRQAALAVADKARHRNLDHPESLLLKQLIVFLEQRVI